MARQPKRSGLVAVADTASWCCALALVALLLVGSLGSNARGAAAAAAERVTHGAPLSVRPCEEIYVVGEGETLHSISDKCGDPFILEQNPHVHDPDDVFPGLVIKITPSKTRQRNRDGEAAFATAYDDESTGALAVVTRKATAKSSN